jgi:hypothetical protein
LKAQVFCQTNGNNETKFATPFLPFPEEEKKLGPFSAAVTTLKIFSSFFFHSFKNRNFQCCCLENYWTNNGLATWQAYQRPYF